MNQTVSAILRPQVQVPITRSTYTFNFIVYNDTLYVKITNKQKEVGIGPYIFLLFATSVKVIMHDCPKPYIIYPDERMNLTRT